MEEQYKNPMQVLFDDKEEEGEIKAGIAYGNEVICACCGNTFPLDEVEIIAEMSWVDFSYSIT